MVISTFLAALGAVAVCRAAAVAAAPWPVTGESLATLGWSSAPAPALVSTTHRGRRR